MNRYAESISEVVTSGLCIGCGLCEAETSGRIKMVMTEQGSLRPSSLDGFAPNEETRILSACPGRIAEARVEIGAEPDPIWGSFSNLQHAWAKDPDTRYKAATGGVLTALGAYLLDSKGVDFVLHVAAEPDHPMRNTWVISEKASEVMERAGSRYGPTAPLAGLETALEREQDFAIIAKPCDIGAVHALSKQDPRINRFCKIRLVMVCGGQSRLSKSQALLTEFAVAEDDLSTFRYRGFGNPGLTTIETKDGRRFTKTYQELWEDEGTWDLETRCKFCPDPLGEAADIAAADVWSGGGPLGEDDGFNGIIVRSPAGEALVQAATASGHLELGEQITPEQFNDFQPHQVRKKHALAARFQGMTEGGLPVIETAENLRITALGENLPEAQKENQISGTKARITAGKITEKAPSVSSPK